MKLAALIRARRSRLGLSMRSLATQSAVSASSISRIEAGERLDVTISTVLGLAKGMKERPVTVFEAAVEQLGGEDGEA